MSTHRDAKTKVSSRTLEILRPMPTSNLKRPHQHWLQASRPEKSASTYLPISHRQASTEQNLTWKNFLQRHKHPCGPRIGKILWYRFWRRGFPAPKPNLAYIFEHSQLMHGRWKRLNLEKFRRYEWLHDQASRLYNSLYRGAHMKDRGKKRDQLRLSMVTGGLTLVTYGTFLSA